MSQSSAFGGGKKKGKAKGEVNFSQTNHGVSGISNMTGITGVSTKTGGIPDESTIRTKGGLLGRLGLT